MKIKFEPEYILFKYLWLLIIVPKSIQLSLLALFVIPRKKYYFSKVALLFLLFSSINLLSVLINFRELDYRFVAALNTVAVWFIGVLSFTSFQAKKIDMQKIGKYSFINLLILNFLSILYLTFKAQPRFFQFLFRPFLGRTLANVDWILGLESQRLNAFFEYPNLIVVFFLILFPFSYYYLKTNNKKIGIILFSAFSSLPPILTSSRLSLMFVILLLFTALYDLMRIKFSGLTKWLTYILLFPIFMFSYQSLLELSQSLLLKRVGSTNTRLRLYIETLSSVVSENILLGKGIKHLSETAFNLPLGSHSTYLGIFYKTGLIGTFIFLLSIIGLMVLIFKNFKQRNISILHIASFFCILVFAGVEDIDGANWLLVLLFSFWGILSNFSLSSKD